jgi:DNA recombination protein RmuC
MTEHVHFDLQAASEEGRPDLTVGLPGGGVVPIDSKVPLSAYIDATEATNERETAEFIQKHARAFRDTVKRLGSKAYWSQFSEAAEFVVMFVPIESAVSEAFKADRELLDFALRYKVLVATPVTLLALLKSVAYGWQQHQVADNARAIAEAGKDLYNRLSTFVEHMSKVGKSIDTVVKRYNDAVGSLQGRLIPGARKFEELAGKADSLEEPGQITTAPRRLAEELPDDNAESAED